MNFVHNELRCYVQYNFAKDAIQRGLVIGVLREPHPTVPTALGYHSATYELTDPEFEPKP